MKMVIERKCYPPNHNTFTIKPIKEFVIQELTPGIWLDPFARNSDLSTDAIKFITNDLNPETTAQYHMEAKEFMKMFPDEYANGIIFDPPYSARQIKECYNGIGIKCKGKAMTGNQFYFDVIDEIKRVLKPGGKVLSFGWNSYGMGEKRGFQKSKILLVNHASHHNDTICVAEIKRK